MAFSSTVPVNCINIHHWKPTTPPQALVLQILSGKQFSSESTEWGLANEMNLLHLKSTEKYSRHNGLFYCRSGFVISEKSPFLGASPDTNVHDPSVSNPFGLAEIKCPYSFHNKTPFEAAESSIFFVNLLKMWMGGGKVQLKHSHGYFCQVQGQMAITERTWCDFVVYTEKGISIERIEYDPNFWESSVLPKLSSP